jgi:hypothetical protein
MISRLLLLLTIQVRYCASFGTTAAFASLSSSSSSASAINGQCDDAHGEATVSANNGISRRGVLRESVFSIAAATILPSIASASGGGSDFKLFEDKECNFKISVPSTWEQSLQKLPDRRKLVLFVDPASKDKKDSEKTIMFIAYTPVRDDFTSLGSFGSVEQVGQMTVLPKGELAGSEDESLMIKAESKKNAYFFDYLIKAGGQEKMHHRSIFSLSPTGTGGAGAVLVTVNVQTPEDSYKDVSSMFDAMMDSYGKV